MRTVMVSFKFFSRFFPWLCSSRANLSSIYVVFLSTSQFSFNVVLRAGGPEFWSYFFYSDGRACHVEL